MQSDLADQVLGQTGPGDQVYVVQLPLCGKDLGASQSNMELLLLGTPKTGRRADLGRSARISCACGYWSRNSGVAVGGLARVEAFRNSSALARELLP